MREKEAIMDMRKIIRDILQLNGKKLKERNHWCAEETTTADDTKIVRDITSIMRYR